MATNHHAALLQAVEVEHDLLVQLIELNQQLHDVLGTVGEQDARDAAAHAVQQPQLQALVERGRLLLKALQAVRRPYRDVYRE